MRPDFGGNSRLTIKVRSCWPPFTISPAWMKTGSLPLFSISSWFTLPVSRTSTARFANASSSVNGALPGADLLWMKKTVRFSCVTGPEMRTGSDDGAAAKAASADRTKGEAERATSNDQRIWSLPWRRPRRAGKFHRLMAGFGTAGGRNSTGTGKTSAQPATQSRTLAQMDEDKLTSPTRYLQLFPRVPACTRTDAGIQIVKPC